MKPDICCDEMRSWITHENLEIYNHYPPKPEVRDKVEPDPMWGKHSFWIYRRPSFDDDGDGYLDDATAQAEIAFCPFCGQSLEPYKQGYWLIDYRRGWRVEGVL